ncbi:MAG TPA: hypothetical protein VFU21_33090 [Kofleriaceae bacterium]|nr:hypothetical protein [Kofleriaceae bacterium]
MRAVVLGALLGAACSGDPKEAPPDAGPSFLECAGSDQAFVRQAHLALLGRRPRSQAEVNVYADLMAEVRALGQAPGDAGPVEGAPDPRAVVVRALIDSDPDGFAERWGEHVMDALKVPRIEDQSQVACYGSSERADDEGIADGALAAFVRDNRPADGGDPVGKAFTMLDLLRSAIHLDDLSVVYRAHLFALVSRPIPAANVPPVQAELARREDFGLIFDAAYLNRDIVCLGCHNSSGSVTYSDDPALNRHWAMPGLFETAIYGAATGIAPERAHAPFRFDGFVADPFGGGGAVRPWDWSPSCGRFNPSGLGPDPAEVDGRLASLTGDRLTVFELDAALRRGFETLAQDGLVIGEDGTIADPDAAMAYLVAASIVEGVWREVIGTPLTIANYFPRNEAARDVLVELTTAFIRNRFSLRELLVDITATPYFNRPPAEAGCEAEPYGMPAIYDPWVTTDPDESRRGNGPGDAIVPLSARVLLRATWAALEWRRPAYYAFPEESFGVESCAELYTCREMDALCQDEGACCEAYLATCVSAAGEPSADDMRAFERGVGVFLKQGERGFRGLDFQARLVFEDMFGACRNPAAEPDFIARLVERATADPAITTFDLVAALKDRLVGEAGVSHEVIAGVSERAALEAMIGPLAASAAQVPDLDARARELCGVLVSSPQFLLTGMTAPDSTYVPRLTPDEASYGAVCAAVAERGLAGNLALTCADDSLTVSP